MGTENEAGKKDWRPEEWVREKENHSELPGDGEADQARYEGKGLGSRRNTRNEPPDIERMISPAEKERIIEDERKFQSMRGLILECINVLYRVYNVNNLKYFRLRVENAKTVEELALARDMLLTISRYHDSAGK